MKTCSMCNESKDESHFYARRKDGSYQSRCKVCKKAANRQHYLDNRQIYIDKAAKWKANRLEEIRQIKACAGCTYCDEHEPCCLDFHHKDRSLKEFSIGAGSDWGWDRVEKEIAKCIVVCRNCHAKIHAGVLRL